MPPLQEFKTYETFIEIPDAGEDTSSLLGGFRNPELDIVSAPIEPFLSERPSLFCAKTLMIKLRQKGLFDSQASDVAVGESIRSHQHSSRDRLAYNWVKMDQELSLFHDAEQTLSASDLERPLLDPNLPWETRSIFQTSNLYLIDGLYPDVKTDEALSFESYPTLNESFRDFLGGTLPGRTPPRHLQLLLHPLQALVHHSQSLRSWATSTSSPVFSNAANSSLQETRRLLRAWHNLATEARRENTDMHDTTLGLILYHFICLNLVASFVDIERLADRENLSIGFWQQSLQHERCIYSHQETIFHCGQALRYLRAVAVGIRPWWWPAAVHRAILTLWAASTLGPRDDPKASSAFFAKSPWRQGSMDVEPEANMPTPELSIIAIDDVTPEDAAFSDANWSERHVLVLTRQEEGVVALTDVMGILHYGVSLISVFSSSYEGDAVVKKLKDLEQAWEGSNGGHVYYQD
ncbi:hypothetical protein V8C37DRAFT_391967 [Trichoderma ceciliae]